jgi:hypothetical protein
MWPQEAIVYGECGVAAFCDVWLCILTVGSADLGVCRDNVILILLSDARRVLLNIERNVSIVVRLNVWPYGCLYGVCRMADSRGVGSRVSRTSEEYSVQSIPCD